MAFRRRRGYSGSRRGGGLGGLKLRLIIGLAMVAFTMISYLAKSSVNPVTGESQRVGMSAESEVALGLQAIPEMVAQHGGLDPDDKSQQLVDSIGQELLDQLNTRIRKQGGTNPYRFEFHLLADSQTVNAFALPGGQVCITQALYGRLKTKGQLAGVIGHEIGHVIARHGAQRLAKQKLTQGLVGAVGVAGGGYDSARLAQAVGQMINMKYGRGDELESDKWGVRLMTWAGYDPRSMIGVMDILEEASGGGGSQPEMMSTHPKPANRRAYIEEVIESEFANGLPPNLQK